MGRGAQRGWADVIAQFDLGKALKRALGGGLSGAAAMVLQVLLLMVSLERSRPATIKVTSDDRQPLRTIMNYQYRFGTTFTVASKTLYADGGFGRYYQGLGAALIQGTPLACADLGAQPLLT